MLRVCVRKNPLAPLIEWWGSAGPWVIAPRECLNGLALRIKSRAGTKSETPPFSARAGAGALQRPFSVY